ncbi:polysaccharide biosynthesis tyrosine autokinase [Actinomyces weissii]|uniref:non-specific protein-tyrosine kinase n=1 Tax=Actinomyces weissii TaxID=675090 RepID=A0A7T7MAQ7_9ACTO|nr:polysaccharide biosynthesis tyrosine autokinase [Actinomyces weissii]QQM67928.1 polysaccharide biosynthesis tyrosine autokinase [Actinomyces weissii]
MTLEDLLKVTRQQIGLIVLGLVLGLAGAAGLVYVTPVTYSASAIAYVRVTMPDDAGTGGAGAYYAASQLANQKVKAFVSVFSSQAVAQGVIDTLGLETTPSALAGTIQASNQTNSLTITVTATGETPKRAQVIADETVHQAQQQIKQLEGENSPVEIVLMSSSTLSSTVKNPSVVKYMGAGTVGGLIIGYVLALLRALLDKRIRTSEDVSSVMDEPVIGLVPTSDVFTQGPEEPEPDYRVEESLRKLRTNLRYARVDQGLHKLVVTSSVQGEGKSTVSTNLARVMALAGEEVVLIEGDMRRPVFKERFSLSSHQTGLSQLLVGATTLEQAMVQTKVPGLYVIPAGDTPPNPSELLGSERLSQLVDYLTADRLVIIDAPPVLPVTDAVALSERMDGVVLVARAKKTTTDQLKLTKETIERGGGTVLGVVLNQVAVSGLGRLRYGETEYAYTAAAYPAGTADRNERKARRRRQPSAEPHLAQTQEKSVSSGQGTTDFVNMLEKESMKGDPAWSSKA